VELHEASSRDAPQSSKERPLEKRPADRRCGASGPSSRPGPISNYLAPPVPNTPPADRKGCTKHRFELVHRPLRHPSRGPLRRALRRCRWIETQAGVTAVGQGFCKAFGGVGAEEIQSDDGGPMEDHSDHFSARRRAAVLGRYDELGEVSRQAVAKRMGETTDLASIPSATTVAVPGASSTRRARPGSAGEVRPALSHPIDAHQHDTLDTGTRHTEHRDATRGR